jgi:hypothetical protein
VVPHEIAGNRKREQENIKNKMEGKGNRKMERTMNVSQRKNMKLNRNSVISRFLPADPTAAQFIELSLRVHISFISKPTDIQEPSLSSCPS